ncbi:hypothetical protein DVV97_15470 [Clostridium botulinum]|nr:hypothetical protein [Clostridium botulinum]
MFPCSIDVYKKDSMSKIELAESLIESLTKPENKGYVLYDSWYSSKAIFTKAHITLRSKFHKFATTLNMDDFYLVTIKNKQYYIYNYVGNLKDRKNV